MSHLLRHATATGLLLWLSTFLGVMHTQAQPNADRQVDALLAQMTLDEKIGQMTLLELGMVSTDGELDPAKLREVLVERHVGALLNTKTLTLAEWQAVVTTVQEVATEQTRLGIPLLFGIDAVHGHNYLAGGVIFPHNIAMAATWDPDLVRLGAEITAVELRASGINWNYSPVFDVVRQPLWSRFFETYGEDPYLVAELGKATVKGLQGEGLQGDDMAAQGRVASTAKHFLGYGIPLTGMDRTPAWIPERILRETFLPPFQEAIEAGVSSMMINSGEINGEPTHASYDLVTKLLRDELGFEGVAVTDWEDVDKLRSVHRVAATKKDAVRMAILAGIDMNMVPLSLEFNDLLAELVEEGAVPMARIDEAVRRILTLKVRLGLFDDPYPDTDLTTQVGSAASKAASLRAAQEAVTLLKNEDDVLPLARDARVLLTGPGATSLSALHGSWTYSWQGLDEDLYPDETLTFLEALQAKAGAEQITYVPGATFEEEVDIAAAVEAAREADVAVIALAEQASVEQIGTIFDLRLPEAQTRLVEAIAETGTPVVLVLVQNRPRIIREADAVAQAVVLGYQPGTFGANALADVLYGDINPSGKLPFTYPRYTGSLLFYDRTPGEEFVNNEDEPTYNPQYEFGHGLSYTTFAYSDLTLSATEISPDDEVTVSVTVTNTGDRAGEEVVLWFVGDLVASITPAVKQLRGFEKIALAPGERRVVTVTLDRDDLAFVGTDLQWIVEPGDFTVMVGDQEATFTVR
ncbi:MAG: glycoside hydrolase family 3 N-terminal domain-containing protein [Bacteroidota bacterium]